MAREKSNGKVESESQQTPYVGMVVVLYPDGSEESRYVPAIVTEVFDNEPDRVCLSAILPGNDQLLPRHSVYRAGCAEVIEKIERRKVGVWDTCENGERRRLQRLVDARRRAAESIAKRQELAEQAAKQIAGCREYIIERWAQGANALEITQELLDRGHKVTVGRVLAVCEEMRKKEIVAV